MSTNDTELLKEFSIESQEHLADIENQLLTLESQGENMDVALVNTVFRAIHSIKGAAGFMGLDTLGGLAHRAEEVLGKLRSKDLRPTSIVINTLLKATDRLKELIDEVENSNGQDVSRHVSALEDILEGRIDLETPVAIDSPNVSTTSSTTSSTIGSTFSSPELQREFLVESFDQLEQIERDIATLDRNAHSDPSLKNLLNNLQSINAASEALAHRKLEQVSKAAETLVAGITESQYPFDAQISESVLGALETMRKLLFSIENSGSEGPIDHQFTVDFLGAIQSVKAPVVRGSATLPAAVADQRVDVTQSAQANSTTSKLEPTNGLASKNPPVDSASKTEPKSTAGALEKLTENRQPASADASAADSTIRVDVALLDKLMTRVGELVLARNQILQFNSTIEDAGLQNAVQRLNLITSELQEGVMKTRMQPIGNVWTKFPRLVRDLAAMCDKQCRIEMEGKETELDKTIIEAIKDPLTHLVRNTVDHGIEKPEIRRQVGKPVEGCLTLKAYHEGGQVNIEIVDDGGGLNFERIKAKAVEKGLVSPDEAARMPEREVGNLIFLPGFSTAEKVSNVSGRGVGMDVVRTNIEKIGGTVDLQSQTGKGTTIKIKIPLTLAIVPALIVTADGDRYAIPQVNLLELVRLEDQIKRPSVEWIQGAPVYRLRGQLLPLVCLRGQLGLSGSGLAGNQESLNIVVLKADDRQFGLIVDRINDSEEIVVKPLGKQLKDVPIYSGTTIMGDGRVALILDVIGLAHSAKVISGSKDRGSTESHDSNGSQRTSRQSLLILSAGHDRRFALPLSQVTRLEKVIANSIEHSRNREVVQYRGEIMPLVRLSETMGVASTSYDSEVLDVVVYTQDDRSVGLIVDQILDIVESDITACNGLLKDDDDCSGPQSSIVIQDHVTDLLDLPTLVGAV